MFVILEGVDGSGKSSLAESVAREIERRHPGDRVHVLHSGPLKRDPVEEYVFQVQDYVPGSKTHIIADRWHWGEQVYGPLYRGKSTIKPAVWRWMELWLQTRGARTWLVTNTDVEIAHRLALRGEDFLLPEDIGHVIHAFNEIPPLAPTFADTVSVDGDVRPLVDRIVDDAEFADGRARLLSRLSTSYVGRTFSDPNIIMVGDKRGGSEPFPTRGAFYPVNGNSADFLWNALPLDMWEHTAVINVNDDLYNLEHFFEWHENAKIVALGREAEKGLTKLGVKYGSVAHPQAIRRFHNSKQREYGAIINRAASMRQDFSKWPN